MFQLAEALHKTVEEIMEMSASEFMGWVEYYKIKENGVSEMANASIEN